MLTSTPIGSRGGPVIDGERFRRAVEQWPRAGAPEFGLSRRGG
jgi:hypothetical protein